MADTTISGTSRKNTSDWDDAPIPYAPPPSKTATTTATTAKSTVGASSSPLPPTTNASSYDPKDAAKYMPVTPLAKSGPTGPMELSLDTQKAAVESRLSRPIDYPQRRADEALRDDLARRIVDRDAQAKAAAKDAQCPTRAACQPVPNGYDPNQGGWTITRTDHAPQPPTTRQGQLAATKDDRVRVGFADATTVKDSGDGRERVDQVAVGVAKGQNQVTGQDGVVRTTTITVGTAFAQTGPTNADGSTGIGFDVGVTAIGVERNLEAPDGTAITVGLSAGASVGGSLGVKAAKNGGSAVCGRAELGPVTVGACVPVKQGADGSDT